MEKKFQHPFVSLKYPNFRYYWFGMCASLIGTWMQNIAQPWLALELTKSPVLLGVIGALQFSPMLFFGLFAGAIVERFSKKKIIICTQLAAMVITLVLAILTFSGHIAYWHLLISSLCLGIVNVFDMPARQTFVSEIVEREDLQNAVSLNSMAFNVARIIGPAIAGIVMGTAGVAMCFLINGISFAAVLIGLFFVRSHEEQHKNREHKNIFKEVKAGIRYIIKHPFLWKAIVVMAIIGTFAPNLNIMIPIYAKTLGGSNPALVLGMLMSLMGIGSFTGAMFTASLKGGPKKNILLFGPALIGFMLIILGVINYVVFFGIGLILFGFSLISYITTANSTVQLYSNVNYRARVMSIYSLVFTGTTPIGNLYAGFMTEHFGYQGGFIACGAICLVLLSIFGLFQIKLKQKATA